MKLSNAFVTNLHPIDELQQHILQRQPVPNGHDLEHERILDRCPADEDLQWAKLGYWQH